MKRYRCIVLDLDGTIYRDGEAIPSALRFIESLQARGIEPFFATNNATRTRQETVEKLGSFGVRTDVAHVMTSGYAAAQWLAAHRGDRTIFVIGTPSLRKELETAGLKLGDARADLVLIGLDPHVAYGRLAEASLAVRAGAELFATNSDRVYPSDRGLVPGNGTLAQFVSYAAETPARFFGKPEPHMLDILQREHGFAREDMVMIGDNYETDILAGIRFGIDTVHVETGVTSAADAAARPVPPTALLPSLDSWEL